MIQSNIQITRLSPDRWKDFRDLRLESLKRAPEAFESSFKEETLFKEEEWRQRLGNVIFALKDNLPVGMITVLLTDRPRLHHIAHFFGFYVRKEAQGHGIGRRLLEEAVEFAVHQPGILKAKLTVITTALAAIHLYEDMGFEKVGIFKKEIKVEDQYYDDIIMEKILK